MAIGGVTPVQKRMLMRPSVVLDVKRSAVREAVGRYRTANPRVFGSVLHGTDQDRSDIDLLVDALPGATLFDLGGLQDELELLPHHVIFCRFIRRHRQCQLSLGTDQTACSLGYSVPWSIELLKFPQRWPLWLRRTIRCPRDHL